MTQGFKNLKTFLDISIYYWLLLKSYDINLKLTAPIGFKKTFSGSQIIVSVKSLWFQMASAFSSRPSLLNFWFLPDFVVVFVVVRLFVMSN